MLGHNAPNCCLIPKKWELLQICGHELVSNWTFIQFEYTFYLLSWSMHFWLGCIRVVKGNYHTTLRHIVTLAVCITIMVMAS